MPFDTPNMQKEAVNIYEILDRLKIRRAMFLGNHYNFNSLDSFITGFMLAASDDQVELNDYPNFGYFNTWLLGHLDKHYGFSGGWHWQITNRNPSDDQKAFDEFFHFLNIFKESKTHCKFKLIDEKAINFYKSSPITRFEIIDGKEIPLSAIPSKITWTTIDNSSTVWISYLDKGEKNIYNEKWFINSGEAVDSLNSEFGILNNDWSDVS